MRKIVRIVVDVIILGVVIFLIVDYINTKKAKGSLTFENRELKRQVQSLQNELNQEKEVQALLEDELKSRLSKNQETTTQEQSNQAYDEEAETVKVRIVNHDAVVNMNTDSWQTLSKENQDVYFAVNRSDQPFYLEFKTNAHIALDSVVVIGDENWSYDTDLHQMELHRDEAEKNITVKLPGFGFVHVGVIQK